MMESNPHDQEQADVFDVHVEQLLNDAETRTAARSEPDEALRAAAMLADQPIPLMPDAMRERLRARLNLPAEPTPVVRPNFTRWLGRMAAVFVVAIMGGALLRPAVNDSLPGEALYSIKRGAETVQSALTQGEQAQAELRLQQAQRRLDEATQLTEERQLQYSPELLGEAYAQVDAALTTGGDAARQATVQEQAAAVVTEAQALRNGLTDRLPEASSIEFAQYEQRLTDQLLANDADNASQSTSVNTGLVYAVSITAGNINVRSEPSLDSAVLQTIAHGSALERLAQDGQWTQVRLPDGTIGWIHASLLRPDPVADEIGNGNNGNGQGNNNGNNGNGNNGNGPGNNNGNGNNGNGQGNNNGNNGNGQGSNNGNNGNGQGNNNGNNGNGNSRGNSNGNN